MIKELQYTLKFYKGKYIILFFVIFLNVVKMAISLVTPLLYSDVIDYIVLRKANKVFGILIVLCIVQLFGIGAGYIARLIETRLTREINYIVKERIADSLLSVPAYIVNEYSKGKIQVLLTMDTVVPASFTMTILNSILNAVFIFGAAFTIWSINWKMACIVIATYPITLLVNKIYNKKIQKTAIRLSKENDVLMGTARKMAESLSDIKIQNGRFKILEQYSNVARVNRDVHNEHLLYTIQNSSIISLLSYANYILLTAIGAYLVLHGEIALGSMVAFNSYSKTLSSTLDSIVQLKTNLQPGLVSIHRLKDIEHKYEEWKMENHNKRKIEKAVNSIRFENVSFCYDTHEVIDNCNLDFHNGIIGIKGQNGCGKTTLLKLILNEYEVQKGNIYLNELNIKDIQYLSLQERISYVGADKHVYSLSVRDTLLLFSDKNNIAEKKVKEVLRLLNIYDEFQSLPKQLETIIGEECDLSSGQIQKLQLARAILKEPDIFLFDEAFSNLDKETKNKVLLYIKEKYQNKIIIIISHNHDDYEVCDYVIELSIQRNGGML